MRSTHLLFQIEYSQVILKINSDLRGRGCRLIAEVSGFTHIRRKIVCYYASMVAATSRLALRSRRPWKDVRYRSSTVNAAARTTEEYYCSIPDDDQDIIVIFIVNSAILMPILSSERFRQHDRFVTSRLKPAPWASRRSSACRQQRTPPLELPQAALLQHAHHW